MCTNQYQSDRMKYGKFENLTRHKIHKNEGQVRLVG
jgi:hypothetical protein